MFRGKSNSTLTDKPTKKKNLFISENVCVSDSQHISTFHHRPQIACARSFWKLISVVKHIWVCCSFVCTARPSVTEFQTSYIIKLNTRNWCANMKKVNTSKCCWRYLRLLVIMMDGVRTMRNTCECSFFAVSISRIEQQPNLIFAKILCVLLWHSRCGAFNSKTIINIKFVFFRQRNSSSNSIIDVFEMKWSRKWEFAETFLFACLQGHSIDNTKTRFYRTDKNVCNARRAYYEIIRRCPVGPTRHTKIVKKKKTTTRPRSCVQPTHVKLLLSSSLSYNIVIFTSYSHSYVCLLCIRRTNVSAFVCGLVYVMFGSRWICSSYAV